MVMIVPGKDAPDVISQTESLGIGCFDIGSVVTAVEDSRVRYR
jgi:hypothetical protein